MTKMCLRLFIIFVSRLRLNQKCLPTLMLPRRQFCTDQIKSLLLSHHHSTSALVSEILTSVLQTVQKNPTIYIWTVHIYRLYRRQCAKYTYIYSVHIVYYKDILNFQTHYTPYVHIYIMYTIYTLCSLYIVIM